MKNENFFFFEKNEKAEGHLICVIADQAIAVHFNIWKYLSKF